MAAVIGEVAPYALVIAMSPSSVIVTILLLFTSQAAASAFLAGRVGGIALASGAFAALASVVELSEETPGWAAWTKLGLGLVLPLGVRLWWGAGRPGRVRMAAEPR